jgi:hypothetical protein
MAQLRAQQQQQAAYKWNGGGRGRGYRANPYAYYGGAEQQYAQPGIRPQAATGYGYMDGGFQHAGQTSQYAPRQPTPQAGGYYPPPQLVRGPRPPTRADAMCYKCGEIGHFSRDKACLQQNVDAYQGMLAQQMAAGAAGGGGQHPAAASGGPAQITYMAPGSGDPSGSG